MSIIIKEVLILKQPYLVRSDIMPIPSPPSPSLSFFYSLLWMMAFCVFVIFYSSNIQAEESINNKTLQIGTYSCPPFVMIDESNDYQGLAFLLWNNIATKLNLKYTVQVLPLKDLLAAVASGKLDIGLSCISITPEREEILDFSHSFMKPI